MVKNLRALQETWVQSLGLEDPLKKGMAFPFWYSSLESSMDGGASWAAAYGIAELDTIEWLTLFIALSPMDKKPPG